MSYGGDPRFNLPGQVPTPQAIIIPPPPQPAPKPFVNLQAIAAEQAGPRYFGQTQEPTARDVLAQRDSIPQAPPEDKPYIGGFDSVPTPIPSSGLGGQDKTRIYNQVIQNSNNDIAGINGFIKLANADAEQKNQVIQNANTQVAIDNANAKFDTMGFIDKATKQGVTSFDILGPSKIGGAFGSQGERIATTTPDKALSDLQKYQSQGIPVKLSYSPPQSEQGAVPFLGLGSPLVSTEANIPKSKLPAQYNTFNDIFSGETSVSQYKQPTFGTALLTEGLAPKSDTAKLPSTGFLDVLQFVPVGGEAKAVQKIAEPVVAKGIVKDITSGVLATESKPLLAGTTRINKNLFETSIGTEGLGTKVNEKIFPQPGSNIEPTLKTTASQAKEGEANIPQIFIGTGKGGVTGIVPKVIDTGVVPQKALIQDFTGNAAKTLGAKPAPEYGANIFSLDVTPKNISLLGEAERSGRITREANIFLTPSSDVAKNVPGYVEAAQNPGILTAERKITGRRYTDLFNYEPVTTLKETRPDIVRGDVLGFYRVGSKGFTQPVEGEVGSKGANEYFSELSSQRNKPVKNPIAPEEIIPVTDFSIPQTTGGRLNKPMRSWSPAQEFGISEPEPSTKPTKTVTRETSETLSRIFGNAGAEQKTSQNLYTGFAPPVKRQKEETVYDFVAYPQGTEEKLTGRQKQNQGYDILQEFTQKQEEAQRSTTLSRLTSSQTEKERQGTGLFTGTIQETSPKRGFDVFTVPVQEQKVRPVQSLLTIPITVPPNKEQTPGIPFAGGGSMWFGYSGDEKPKKGGKRNNFGLWNTNPNNVGEFYTPGTQEFQVSASPDIFGRNDRAIARSTRKAGNQSFLNYGTTIVKKGKGKATGKMKNGIFF